LLLVLPFVVAVASRFTGAAAAGQHKEEDSRDASGRANRRGGKELID
jgi:hypothetical protein